MPPLSTAQQISKKNILGIAPDSMVETTRRMLLANAGFQVEWARDVGSAKKLLDEQEFSLVIFGARLDTSDALALAASIRRSNPQTKLIAAGLQRMRLLVDAYLEPQEHPNVFLRMVGSLLMQAHGHPAISGTYVAYADGERRFTSVTDGLCDLLGYSREDLLHMTIDEITYPESADVPAQFRDFVAAGRQAGRFLLQHRDRTPVPVTFEAHVLEDGCMVSVLTPAA